jgi:hypothetical protein
MEHADGQAIETLTALTKPIPEEAELRGIMRPGDREWMRREALIGLLIAHDMKPPLPFH